MLCIYHQLSLSLSLFCFEAILIVFPPKRCSYFSSSAADASLLHWPFTVDRFYRPDFYLLFIDCRRFILMPIWLPTKRCDASNFRKSVASYLAKHLIFVVLRFNDILTTFFNNSSCDNNKVLLFKKDIFQKEKSTTPYPLN